MMVTYGLYMVSTSNGIVYNGKSIYKWMMNGGTSISGNHQLSSVFYRCLLVTNSI